MPSLSTYSAELDYAYAPGMFPAMECLLHRPESCRRVLLHSRSAGTEGAQRLREEAESTISVWKRRTRRFPAFRGRKTASRRRCSASSRMTCALTSRISSCITRRTAAMSARFSARRLALMCRISPSSARAWMCLIPRLSAPAWAASSSCGCMSMMIFAVSGAVPGTRALSVHARRVEVPAGCVGRHS